MKCKNCGKIFKYGKYAVEWEKATELCHDCLNKPFKITSVCRVDLFDGFTPIQVAKMDDSDMRIIASKMASSYCDGGFWPDLKVIAENILENK